jgi:hypothetical protein
MASTRTLAYTRNGRTTCLSAPSYAIAIPRLQSHIPSLSISLCTSTSAAQASPHCPRTQSKNPESAAASETRRAA